MTPGKRKLTITVATLGALLLLAGLVGVLELTDGTVEAVASALALVAIGYCGGNSVEHVARALGARPTPGP